MHQHRLFYIMKSTIKIIFPRIWLYILLRIRRKHFEKELFLIPQLCNKNQIAIDIGANQGIYTYCMAKHAQRVIAFEPNKAVAEALKRVATKNVVLRVVALSDVSGTTLMRIDPTNDGISTIEPNNNFAAANQNVSPMEIEVTTQTLDSFELSDISLIKIDVEGHEEAVLRGALKTIAGSLPVLIIETENQHNSGAPLRVTQMLRKLGYEGFFIKDKRLQAFADLQDHDTDVTNWDKGLCYINNFIYIPRSKRREIENIERVALALR
jgi:FkbM family methyltransferase